MNQYSGKVCSGLVILLALLVLVQVSSAAQSGPPAEWTMEYHAGEEVIMSVCESSSGGYYAAGSGPEGRLVMKIDAKGDIIWKRYIPGSDENGTIRLIEESPAGGLILFADGEDLIKTDSGADVEWEFHQPIGKVYSVEVAPDGSSVLAGTYFQGFLTRVSDEGSEVWNKSFSNPEGGGQYILRSVQNDPDGGFIIAGYINPILMVTDYRGFMMRVDENGDQIWARQYPGNSSGMLVSVACQPSGGYAAARFQTLAGDNESSEESLLMPSIMFTDSEGGITGYQYYDDYTSYVFSIKNSGDDGYYLSGLLLDETSETGEYSIMRTGLSGAVIWDKALGGLELRSFAQTSDGGFIIATGSPDGSSSFITRYGEDSASEAPGFGTITALAALGAAGLFVIFRKKS